MKIRWNINEHSKRNYEESKISSINNIQTGLKASIADNINLEKETAFKPLSLFERGKRNHEKMQENNKLFGITSADSYDHPLKLMNKGEVPSESKKMILIDKNFDCLNKKDINFPLQGAPDAAAAPAKSVQNIGFIYKGN